MEKKLKFKFKIQQYQTDAVENTVEVFRGQPNLDASHFGIENEIQRGQARIAAIGYGNSKVMLSERQLLENIQNIQEQHMIPKSSKLSAHEGYGACQLDIEMETGTGKTYVYIKTMYELYKRYGWSKYIVVVPSIAIREGVNKSFEMLEEHFMGLYHQKIRFFVYNSDRLNEIDSHAADSGINVMIINMQAFGTSFNENGRSKASRKIYSERDSSQSRKPIDLIAETRPIVIVDEPQRAGGRATQEGLKNFHPLFVLNYSATHKNHHDCIYALDAVDAYKQKLVKKISVKGISLLNLKGTSSYIYCDDIIVSKQAPVVRLEIEVKHLTQTKREMHIFRVNNKLQDCANLEVYKDFVITDINANTNTVTFKNGVEIRKGEAIGDVNEETIQRVQIRETIRSHFEKERALYQEGIKTLSLFFIDKVANYKSYDENGEVVHGPLWKMFEEEYMQYLNEHLSLFEDDYQKYLNGQNVADVHDGYFSIDPKTRHVIDGDGERDVSAYETILKNKEELLRMGNPLRFIFSHSALREGWDNPNVFQICTLRHTNSDIVKRQEVGRGLRICVDKEGNRMDYERLGDRVHEINRLTVIANENYDKFVDALQQETLESLRERPKKVDIKYFVGKKVEKDDRDYLLTDVDAAQIITWMLDKKYIDKKGVLQQKLNDDVNAKELAPMPLELQPIKDGLFDILNEIYNPTEGMFENENGASVVDNNHFNINYQHEKFQELWKEINHKYVYSVSYDSDVLVDHSIGRINKDLKVDILKYVVEEGSQSGEDGLEFEDDRTRESNKIYEVGGSMVKYDLVHEIAKETTLTRKTVVRILQGMDEKKLAMFRYNPVDFIRHISKLIKEEKARLIVKDIRYKQTDEVYEDNIFLRENIANRMDKAYKAKKHILDYVITDGYAERSVERKFAETLDKEKEVCVYAKLPCSYQIPTPVGNYSPDWAIAFNDNCGVKHIYFIAETKGGDDNRIIERTKIECAEKLFNNISTSKVRYHKVTSYDDMLDCIEAMD